MTEYITKDQAIHAMEQVTQPECFIEDTRKNFARIIEELPAADVVEVVQCKDCRYFTPQAGWGGGQCSYLEDKFELPEVLIFDDDYCSDGERKDGGESDD